MAEIDLVRLIIRIIDAYENWMVPQSKRLAAAVYVGVKTLPEKFRFRPPAVPPWVIHSFRLPAVAALGRIRGKLPVWCHRFLRWLRYTAVEALVIGAGTAVLVLLWMHLFCFS